MIVKLLIADDENFIRNGLLSLDWGKVGISEVYSAANGLEAKTLLSEFDIDIVISDIKMPGLSGLELSEYLYKKSKDTIIILLTGFIDFQYAKESIRYKVFDYLLKPIKPHELFSTVQRAIQVLEQQKYKNQVVRKYEDAVGSYNTTMQILYGFGDMGAQMMDILIYIAKNYNQDLSLNMLAERYHFTAIYLSRLIKKDTGYSFIDILTSIRLMNAVELLTEGKDKINVICEKTGFKDQRYFSQVFKKVFGYTPGEYRKNENPVKVFTIIEILDLISMKKQLRGSMT